MSESIRSTANNISSPSQSSSVQYSSNDSGLFSNKNVIIIALLALLILSLIGINLLLILGNAVSSIIDPIVPAINSLLGMIGFTTGQIINNSADLVANTADVGIDIAKGTTRSIGDLLINSMNPGLDLSKQIDLTDAVGISNIYSSTSSEPKPVQSSEPTVTPISTQKHKAGWCYIGDFSGSRGCVEVKEQDKCISGLIFANKSECLNPPSESAPSSSPSPSSSEPNK
jgi:hypothetical protein